MGADAKGSVTIDPDPFIGEYSIPE